MTRFSRLGTNILSELRRPRPEPKGVLPIGEDAMFKWRLLVEEGRKAGHTFPQPDLLIAATALLDEDAVETRLP